MCSRITLRGVGVYAAITYLSEQEYQTVQRDYKSKGKCSAPYLNRTRRILKLIAPDEAIVAKLKNINRFAKFDISGNSYTFLRGEIGGRNLRVPNGYSALKVASLRVTPR